MSNLPPIAVPLSSKVLTEIYSKIEKQGFMTILTKYFPEIEENRKNQPNKRYQFFKDMAKEIPSGEISELFQMPSPYLSPSTPSTPSSFSEQSETPSDKTERPKTKHRYTLSFTKSDENPQQLFASVSEVDKNYYPDTPKESLMIQDIDIRNLQTNQIDKLFYKVLFSHEKNELFIESDIEILPSLLYRGFVPWNDYKFILQCHKYILSLSTPSETAINAVRNALLKEGVIQEKKAEKTNHHELIQLLDIMLRSSDKRLYSDYQKWEKFKKSLTCPQPDNELCLEIQKFIAKKTGKSFSFSSEISKADLIENLQTLIENHKLSFPVSNHFCKDIKLMYLPPECKKLLSLSRSDSSSTFSSNLASPASASPRTTPPLRTEKFSFKKD